jgi:peptidoglycan/xylan/chitin deacetylase (PgdA/CDA1 family)
MLAIYVIEHDERISTQKTKLNASIVTLHHMAINRRQFLFAAAAAAAVPTLNRRNHTTPTVSFTIDDPKVSDQPLMSQFEIADRMLTALGKAKVKAGLFVCGKRVDADQGQTLVKKWDDAGHLIGNHTYSHLNYNLESTTFESFSDDIITGEHVIDRYKNFEKCLRFPYLKEGDTAEKRDLLRTWMHEHNYRPAYVTIDASDWYIDDRLKKRLAVDRHTDLKPYREFYLQHLWDRSRYYDNLSQQITGRSIHHTLLLHHALVNGLFLADLIALYKSKGWRVIDVRESYRDPIFLSEPKSLPAGESLLWALAKETGKYDSILRYPGEDSKYVEPEMNKRGL